MTDATPATPTSSAEVGARLARARAAFSALRPRVIEAGPWALAADFGTGPEASWGVREVLTHVAEMLPFWQGEVERIVEGAAQAAAPVPFGRLAGDAMRLGILERDRTLPLTELFDRIDLGIARWQARTTTLTDDEAGARGMHPREGEVSAGWVRDRFVVQHLDEHLAQLEALLVPGR